MKFVGQGFQKLEPKQDKQTNATECITTPHMRTVNRVTCRLSLDGGWTNKDENMTDTPSEEYRQSSKDIKQSQMMER